MSRAAAKRALSVLPALVMVDACSLAFPVHVAPDDAGGGATSSDGGPASSYRAVVLADGPAVYLRLGESAGPSARDEIGAYSGSYPGGGISYAVPGAIAGDPDTAVAFDGTSGIAMPVGLDFPGVAPFTVEVWALQTGTPGLSFVLDHESFTTREGWTLHMDDSVALERWHDGSPSGSVASQGKPLPRGAYHHVAASFDGSVVRLFIDGALVASSPSLPVPLKSLGNGWTIGAQNCCTGAGFIGSLDEIAVYDKVLSAAQIKHHYDVGSGRGP